MGGIMTERTCERMWVARIVFINDKTDNEDDQHEN